MSQAHGSGLWQEPAAAGATPTVASLHFVDDGLGGYKVEDWTLGHASSARMLADAYSGFTVTDGPDNPSALDELEMIDIRGAIETY